MHVGTFSPSSTVVLHFVLKSRIRTNQRRKEYEKIAVLGYHAASSDNSFPVFRENISVTFLGVKTDRISRNFGKELPLFSAWQPKSAQFLLCFSVET